MTNAAFNAGGHDAPFRQPQHAREQSERREQQRRGAGRNRRSESGSGGSSSTAPKKRASQRAGCCRVHQRTGAISGGRRQHGLQGEAARDGNRRGPHAEDGGRPPGGTGCEALVMAQIRPGPCGRRSSAMRDERGKPLPARIGAHVAMSSTTHRAPWRRRGSRRGRARRAVPGSSSPASDTGSAAPGPPAAPPPY